MYFSTKYILIVFYIFINGCVSINNLNINRKYVQNALNYSTNNEHIKKINSEDKSQIESETAVNDNNNGTNVNDNDEIDIRIEDIKPIETLRAPRYPCECNGGQCGCCTGSLLEQFKQKGCLNITYEPDDFAFNMKIYMNQRVLYNNRISGKNPPPACLRVPRFRAIKLCFRLYNVYFAGRNVHACVDVEAEWQDLQLFHMSLDCVRVGTQGVAVVPPEEGGGLPSSTEDEDDDDIEEYDDSAK